MRAEPAGDWSDRVCRWLLWAASALLVLLSVARCLRAIPNGSYLDWASGSWVTQATDLAGGVLYRPPMSDIGYGGTRHFPLQVFVHAALIRLGLPPLAAGHTIELTAAVAIAAGVYRWLRVLGLAGSLALPCSVLALATGAAQLGMLQIRGDLLPAALNVWALVLCAADLRDRGARRIAWSGLLFTLAWLAKVTTVFGLIAGVTHLFLAGRRRAALGLAAGVSLGAVGALGFVDVLSGGQVRANFAATALAGSGFATTLVRAPLQFAIQLVWGDPITLVLAVVACGAVMGSLMHAWRELASMAYLVTLAVTVAIYGTPGTISNHLVDLGIVSMVVIGAHAASGRIPVPFGSALLAAMGLVTSLNLVASYRAGDSVPRLQLMRRVLSHISDRQRPILAESALLPVLAGQTPVVLDAFTLRLLREQDARVTADLFSRLHQKSFAAVVLEHPPDSASWFDNNHFGPGFIEALRDSYQEGAREERFYVFLPKTD